ncbi:membrane protein [Corynebacterium glutamicum R]|uniref:Membrane protein n=1 Tax=Corynebacterium glutamicum (strain R) TaxID=340322 RepID=A0AB72VF67_CORGB|nr:membrane protein [Corynebacterium glutamicum R]
MSDKKQDLTSSAAGSAAPQTKAYPAMPLPEKQAWPALIALCIGFFMILLDQTIVAVSTPALQADMGASYNEVIWVTSVYLLTFAVPLLVTGRLGRQVRSEKCLCRRHGYLHSELFGLWFGPRHVHVDYRSWRSRFGRSPFDSTNHGNNQPHLCF